MDFNGGRSGGSGGGGEEATRRRRRRNPQTGELEDGADVSGGATGGGRRSGAREESIGVEHEEAPTQVRQRAARVAKVTKEDCDQIVTSVTTILNTIGMLVAGPNGRLNPIESTMICEPVSRLAQRGGAATKAVQTYMDPGSVFMGLIMWAVRVMAASRQAQPKTPGIQTRSAPMQQAQPVRSMTNPQQSTSIPPTAVEPELADLINSELL